MRYHRSGDDRPTINPRRLTNADITRLTVAAERARRHERTDDPEPTMAGIRGLLWGLILLFPVVGLPALIVYVVWVAMTGGLR